MIHNAPYYSRNQALLVLALVAILWSFGGIIIKELPLHPAALAGLRSTFTAIFLLVATGARFNRHPSRAALAAAFAYAVMTLGFVSATKLTTAANAILLQYTAPIYVAFLAHFLLGERLTRRDVGAALMVLAGIALFFADRLTAGGLAGNLIALSSGVAFASFVVATRIDPSGGGVNAVLSGNLVVTALCLPWIIGSGPAPAELLTVAAMAVFQLGVPYVLYVRALPSVSAIEAVLIVALEPILNPIWVALLNGELPGRWSVVGGSIVFMTVLLYSASSVRPPVRRSADATAAGVS